MVARLLSVPTMTHIPECLLHIYQWLVPVESLAHFSRATHVPPLHCKEPTLLHLLLWKDAIHWTQQQSCHFRPTGSHAYAVWNWHLEPCIYHPVSGRAVYEQENRTLKSKLARCCADTGLPWPKSSSHCPHVYENEAACTGSSQSLWNSVCSSTSIRMTAGGGNGIPRCEDAMPTYCSNLTSVKADVRRQVSTLPKAATGAAPQVEAGRLRPGEGPETEELKGKQVARPVQGAPRDAHSLPISPRKWNGVCPLVHFSDHTYVVYAADAQAKLIVYKI